VIVVDSSVWIDYFNGKLTHQTLFLRDEIDRREIVVGDLILCEVLQGFRYNKDMMVARELLLGFQLRDMVGREIALKAAESYRILRARGITVRKTIDVLIGTFCIHNGFSLLHDDRDFDAIEQLGLQVVKPTKPQ